MGAWNIYRDWHWACQQALSAREVTGNGWVVAKSDSRIKAFIFNENEEQSTSRSETLSMGTVDYAGVIPAHHC